MNKNEFELKRLAIEADKFGQVINLVQHGCTVGAVVMSIYLIMTGLNTMVLSNPESLNALSVVIENLKINAILGYVLAAGTSLGWAYERRGKKRALRKSGEFRKEIEKHDPYSPSSNLDENGHTPK